MIGQRFGRLVVLAEVPRRGKARYVLCRCDCGNEKEIRWDNLRSGAVLSCKCLHRETISKTSATHGHARSKAHTLTYKAWASMRARCTSPKYTLYYGRGITFCERWNSFENFLADMGERPGPDYSVERRDNDGNYEPRNCVWATKKEQANNRRTSRFITCNGVTKTLMQWSEATGLGVSCILCRIDVRGWDVERALATPARIQRQPKRKNLHQ